MPGGIDRQHGRGDGEKAHPGDQEKRNGSTPHPVDSNERRFDVVVYEGSSAAVDEEIPSVVTWIAKT